MRIVIREVLNVGGFFAGETVTLAAQRWPEGGPEQTLTIDDAALTNVTARHLLAPGMVSSCGWPETGLNRQRCWVRLIMPA